MHAALVGRKRASPPVAAAGDAGAGGQIREGRSGRRHPPGRLAVPDRPPAARTARLPSRPRRQPLVGDLDRATLQCAGVRRARLRQPRARRIGRRRVHVWVLRKEGSEPGPRQARGWPDCRVRRVARRGHRAAGGRRGRANRAGRRGGAHLGPQNRRHGARAVLREPRQHRRGLSHRREGGCLSGRRREPGGVGDEDSRPRPGDPRGRRFRDAAAHSERVYAALAGPKKLVLVPGAHHNDALTPDAWRQIDDWIASHWPPGPPT